MNRKYINPFAYYRKAKQWLARICYRFGLRIKVVTKVDEFRIKFVTGSYKEYMLRAQESYRREKVTMFWLRELIDSDDVVYDIGANVGAYSLFAGYVVARKGGQVYAFEPAYSNFNSLCLNIIENNLQETVMPYPIALSDKTKEGKFYLRSVIPGDALHAFGKAESEGRSFNHQFRQGVIATSLDEFVLNSDVRFPNHIKIDVDGLEYEVIQGMSGVLKDSRLKGLMIEINSDISQGAIENLINEAGLVEIMSEQWHGRNSYNKLFTRDWQPE